MLSDGLNIKAQKLHDNLEQEDSDDSEDKPTRRNGRRKIKIEYIEDKNRRHITFSKRKAGIMKKAYELSTLTGTQVLLLVVSETGLVYTFTTTKLQPIVTKPEGKNLIQACLNTPDPETATEEAAEKETKITSAENTAQPEPTKASPSLPVSSPSPQPTRQPTVRPPGPKYQYQPTMPMPAAYNQRYLAGYTGNMPPSNYPYGQAPFYTPQSSPYTNNQTNYWPNQSTSPANNERSKGQ